MDSQTHKARHLATHQLLMQGQVRAWGWTDVLFVLAVFAIGFLFSYILSYYSNVRKEKIEEISRKFQGLKGEYEQVHLRMESSVKWRYRLKLAEKVFYIAMLAMGFVFYKSPSLMTWVLTEHPILAIVSLSLCVIGFTVAGWYLEKRSRRNEQLVKKLKEKLKDAKRLLVSQMDPVMVEAVKEIVRGDMREELERLRNSDDGCSEKCKLTTQMLKTDVARGEILVRELIHFNWCDQCKKTTAVQVCHAGCGPKVFAKLVPHMKEYGRLGQRVEELRA